MKALLTALLLGCNRLVAGLTIAAVHDQQRDEFGEQPINRVITLLQEMKGQLEKEAASDSDTYSKMTCWCENNDKLKTTAIADADQKITELLTTVESSAAKLAELGTKIEHKKVELQEQKDALKQARTIREKDYAAFNAEEKELIESITILKNAVEVLGRHQAGLLQMTPAIQESVGSALRWVALKHEELTEMDLEGIKRTKIAPSLLSLAAAGKSSSSAADQVAFAAMRNSAEQDGRVALPVEYAARILAQITAVPSSAPPAKPAALMQQPAHLQNYAPQSGQIFGLLGQMKDEFAANLDSSQQAEIKAAADYAELKAAQDAQIEASTKLLDDLEVQHSTTQKALADAKEDLEATREQRGADVEFLSDLRLKCQALDHDWEQRTKARGEELKAVAEAIAILTEDDARDLFHKKFDGASAASFLQLSRRSVGAGSAASATAARNRASASLMKVARQLMKAAEPNADVGDWAADARAWKIGEQKPHEQLATMAVSIKLDAFTKVKEAIDGMVADLKNQQAQEVDDKGNCTAEFNENEKVTYATHQELGDAEDRIASLEATIEDLAGEIKTAHETIETTKVELKKASETRASENKDFQEEVMDQRAVQQILKKAVARLSSVYKAKGAALVQQDPNPPAQFQAYKQNAGSVSVISLIEAIVEDSAKLEQDAMASEQDSQKAYESFASESDKSVKMSFSSIETKEKQKTSANAEKQEGEADKTSAEGRLEDLGAYKGDLHMKCDFLLKNFDIRQNGRLQEIEALGDAKALLSGMKD